MSILAFILLLLLFIGEGSSHNQRRVFMIRDVLLSNSRQAPASVVVAFICWDARAAVHLVRTLSESGLMISIHTPPELWPLMNLYHDPFTSFILDSSCDGTRQLLAQADRIKLFSPPRRWLLLENTGQALDTEELLQIINKKKNTDIGLNNPANTTHDKDEISLKTNDTKYEFEDSEKEKRNSSRDGCDVNCLKDTLSLLDVFIDSQIMISIRTSDRSFVLVEVFKRGLGQPLVFSLLGHWTEGKGVHITAPLAVSTRRINLHRTQINASMVILNNDTLNHLWDGYDIHIDPNTKLNIVLIYDCMNMMNASIGLMAAGLWGYATNGSWNGMVGYLQRNESEIGFTGLFTTVDRLRVIEYIAMTTPTRAKFIFRKPPLSFVNNVFILPLSTGVWLSSSCLVVICGGLLYAALRWERRRNKDGSEDQDMKEYIRALGVDEEVSWSDVVLLSLGAVCQQGSTTESHGTPGRIISLLMFIAVMFLYTSYSANIVALLQSTTDSISSLEDLLYSRLELGVDDNYVYRYYFQNAIEPVRKAIYEKKIASPGVKPRFYSLKEGMEKLRQDFFAFHVEESLAFKVMSETYTEDEKCGLGSIPGYLQVEDPWVAVRKDTPYKEMFKMCYRKLRERGIQKREEPRFYLKKPECSGQGSSFTSVGIVDFYPALLMWVYGVLFAAVIFLLEVLANKRESYRNWLPRIKSFPFFPSPEHQDVRKTTNTGE